MTAVVRAGEDRYDLNAGDVPSDGTFDFDATAAHQAKRERNQRVVRAMSDSGILHAPSSNAAVKARHPWRKDRDQSPHQGLKSGRGLPPSSLVPGSVRVDHVLLARVKQR